MATVKQMPGQGVGFILKSAPLPLSWVQRSMMDSFIGVELCRKG